MRHRRWLCCEDRATRLPELALSLGRTVDLSAGGQVTALPSVLLVFIIFSYLVLNRKMLGLFRKHNKIPR